MQNKVIAGRYELQRPVGRGGMSIVYLAMDLNLNKTWAVKEIKKHGIIEGQEVQNALLAEAELMKNLEHPSLPRVIDIIEDDEFYYIVMDYVEGETLRDIIDRYGPQSQDKVIKWGKELALVLGYLHSQDPPIIYRDLKPGNIILQPNGSLKIIDFGTARIYKRGQAKDTAPLGTRGYAAPEQYDSGSGISAQTDERTDIYNLGMTMYELLTCKLPSTAPYKLVPVRQINPDVSIGLENIISICTQSDPDDRFQDTQELMKALLNYQRYDEDYVDDLKRSVRKAVIPAILGVLLIFGGIGMLTANHIMVGNQYENLIAETGDPQSHIENLKKAIKLKPEDPEGYQLLLKEYARSDGGMTEEKAREALAVCTEGLSHVNPKSDAYIDINYMIGESHLVYFNGQTDESLRNKIMTAEPFFAAVVATGNTEHEKYAISKAYTQLASFYENYVLDAESSFVFDAGAKEYKEILSQFNEMLDLLNKSSAGGSTQLKVATYSIILSIIDSEKGNFAANVDKKDVDKILTKIQTGTDRVTTSNRTLNEQLDSVRAQLVSVSENLDKAYREEEKKSCFTQQA